MFPLPPDTEALLFDCDGTLADTMDLHFEAWRETLAVEGIDFPRSFINRHAGIPTDLIVLKINEQWDRSFDADKLAAEKRGRFDKQIHLSKPIEEVVAVARQHHGKLAMAVVSGGTRHQVETILRAIDVAELFPVVVTADDPVAPKPSPEVFLEAARQLGVDPTKCHVFEDGEPGIVAARAAGMTVCDVRKKVVSR